METLPILLDGAPTGELSVEESGLYLCFRAVCHSVPQEILRLFAVGERGEVALGVPEPSGREARLVRRLSRREAAGAGTLSRGELRRAGEGKREDWIPAERPERLFRTAFLRWQLRGAAGCLTRETPGARFLALPFDVRRPFLLTGYFCFAVVRQIGGRPYAVLCFDREENPVLRL